MKGAREEKSDDHRKGSQVYRGSCEVLHQCQVTLWNLSRHVNEYKFLSKQKDPRFVFEFSKSEGDIDCVLSALAHLNWLSVVDSQTNVTGIVAHDRRVGDLGQ